MKTIVRFVDAGNIEVSLRVKRYQVVGQLKRYKHYANAFQCYVYTQGKVHPTTDHESPGGV